MRWLILAAVVTAGCQSGLVPSSDGGDPGNDPIHCSPQQILANADEGARHVLLGTPVAYAHNPPSSGPHWPSPHPWGAFNQTIPREWWVHNLEHGGIVLLYNCPGVGGTDGGGPPDGGAWPCPAITDALRQVLAERSPDQFGEVRMLLTADEVAPHAVSAVAWDWVYQSDQVDLAALRCFRDARYGRGPENAP